MTTAIFDLDGTLTTKDTYIPFLGLCLRQLGFRARAAALPFYMAMYYGKAITNERLKEAFLNAVLSGVPVKKLQPVVDKFLDRLMNEGLNDAAVESLRRHLAVKDRVILATASFDIYVRALGEKLGIQEVVCTRTEVKDGFLTGRISGRNCHGAEKLRRLDELLKDSDWKDSVFYTDHHSDAPVLKKASRGILVKPGFFTRLRLGDLKHLQHLTARNRTSENA